MLVRAGADVNHPTKTNSTPLRAACFDGRLDIVKYLTDHSADIHITNKYNNTCLMIAAYKGHVHIVQFLLELGANPNEKANCGATALHFAAECGHVEIVKELLKSGAKIYKNEHGITPLIAAAERTRAEVVEYFVSEGNISRGEKIDAYELLGASYASDKDNYDIGLASMYLMLGMQERFSDPSNIIYKPETRPIPAYDNRLECERVEELQTIQNNSAELHMESLVIRERILGPHNPEVPHPVIFRGAVFADNARFDKCLNLWLHALRLKQSNKVSVVKDLLRFAQVFSQMLHVGLSLDFDVVEEVLEATLVELVRNSQKMIFPGPKDDVETVKDDIECNMVTSLYLIMITMRILKQELKLSLDARESRIHHIVYRLVRVGARNRNGQTLLHLAVNPDTPVDDFHTNHICKFPCALTTKLLITCGANANEMDYNRNTPLHLIVPYEKIISDFFTLHNIIMALVEAGAHMDTVNQSGATPMDAATSGVAEVILRSQNKLSLQCQAARVVKCKGIPYKGTVPLHLEAFIELHGPCHVDSLVHSGRKKMEQHL
ncbi:UNVERIFIED_CONTAM: hypothetical protein GTU68_045574 [Idotea baltica]|nr:hypothetical protein [Idotea baltica]